MDVTPHRRGDVLTCSLCSATFSHPVTLKCSHGLCRSCLEQHQALVEPCKCPVCRGKAAGGQPCSPALGGLGKTPLPEERGQKSPPTSQDPECQEPCGLHGQDLELFCLQDEVLVCVECVAEAHKDHMFCHAKKAARHRKEALRTAQKTLRVKLGAFRAAKDSCNQMTQFIRSQSLDTERQIKDEYERLHKFLRQDMAASLEALHTEEDQMMTRMKLRSERLEKEISSLSAALRSIEQAIGDQDVPFLRNYKDTKTRAQCKLQDPGKISGVIDVVKHLGNLRVKVLRNMLGIVRYTPVILNPNTAHPSLSVSSDLTSVMCSKKEQVPGTSKGLTSMPWVLGSAGYSSGRRSWDVDVAGVPTWGVGVVRESVWKGGATKSGEGPGVCSVTYKDGKYTSDPPTSLEVSGTLPRITVKLDFDDGNLSFCDSRKDKPLAVFPLKEKVFAFFSIHPDSTVPLHISGTRLSICQL